MATRATQQQDLRPVRVYPVDAQPRAPKTKRNVLIAVAVIFLLGLVLGACLLVGMHFSGLGITQAGFTALYDKIVAVMNTSHSMSPLFITGIIVVPTLVGTLLVGLVGKAIADRTRAQRHYLSPNAGVAEVSDSLPHSSARLPAPTRRDAASPAARPATFHRRLSAPAICQPDPHFARADMGMRSPSPKRIETPPLSPRHSARSDNGEEAVVRSAPTSRTHSLTASARADDI